ncbi:PTS sugar transporter subunit IIA [Sphingorhabdus sp. Alg239-R122]|uniref:PTS sugar transporter subunit IIA n=1 Tax=Sphingorhabdus sp. Alg239-R122 TaxID=2305989 RepID=UPI0013DBC02F|nr:PTS sugar transporter subunit IIA [Sphingorhabdus sp. Alg239-R122]
MRTFTLDDEAVLTGAQVSGKTQLLELLAEKFSQCYGLDRASCLDCLDERERLGSTGFGRGIAIPHGKIEGMEMPVAVFVQLARPMDFDAVDKLPVDIVFALMSPVSGGSIHLQALASISRLSRDEKTVSSLRGVKGHDAAYAVLASVIDRDAA